MTTKNIEININNGNGYDVLYPKTDVGLVANAVSMSQFNNLNGTVNSLNSQIGWINSSINTIKGQLGSFRSQTIEYTGNGGSDSSNKTTVNFSFVPKLVEIFGGDTSASGAAIHTPDNTINSRVERIPYTQEHGIFTCFNPSVNWFIYVGIFYSGAFSSNSTTFSVNFEVTGTRFSCWTDYSVSGNNSSAQYKSAAQYNENRKKYCAIGYTW